MLQPLAIPTPQEVKLNQSPEFIEYLWIRCFFWSVYILIPLRLPHASDASGLQSMSISSILQSRCRRNWVFFPTVGSGFSVDRGTGQRSARNPHKRETKRNVCKNPLGRRITKCQTRLVRMCWETQNINSIITRILYISSQEPAPPPTVYVYIWFVKSKSRRHRCWVFLLLWFWLGKPLCKLTDEHFGEWWSHWDTFSSFKTNHFTALHHIA